MSPPRRALIAITSAVAPLNDGHFTGLFIEEALRPFNVLKAAGFEVDIVSEKGSYGLDWLSQQPDFFPEELRKQFEDVSGEFRKKLDAGLTPEKVDASKYGVFFASAGHAAMIDYPTAKGLQSLATKIYASGGIMSAVCHGAAIFPGITDDAGVPIAKGKTITGFTTQAEIEMNVMEILRSWPGVKMVDEWAEVIGAKYVRPPGVWDSFHVTDGRIVTGTNPQSSDETAKAAVEAFEKL